MASEGPIVDEIAGLLDQCSPDELANILQAIEGGDMGTPVPDMATPVDQLPAGESPPSALPAPVADMSPQSPTKVLPPAGPPPAGAGRRPVPQGVRRQNVPEEEQEVTLSEAKKLLDDHSSAVVSEVRKMVPYMGMSNIGGGETLDLETLTKILSTRDDEVKELEERLNTTQAELSAKDRRVSDLGSELDLAIREVRHRQLDLEFQQLKLEETVRSNAGMEAAQKNLVARVEEVALHSRHAALDVDIGRTNMSMAGFGRVQGSLPWTVRKSRPAPTAGIV